MKAVVMAGGSGTRLRPLTSSTPKPLLPVVGRTMLEHLLLLLGSHGVSEAVITVHYLAQMVRSHQGSGTESGVQLSYATESRPMGTAGSVKLAESRLQDAPFLVISGDGVTDMDLSRLAQAHEATGALVTVCLARRADPMGMGLVVTDDEGRVTRFLEKPGWSQVFTDTVNTGIYMISPEVLAEIPDDEPADWARDVFPRLLARGAPIYGHVGEGYWADVGTLDAYRAVQIDALEGKVKLNIPGQEVAPGVWFGSGVEVNSEAQLQGPVVLGDNVRVAAGAKVGPLSVVGRHSIVGPETQIERSVVMDNVYFGPGVQLHGCVVGRDSDLLDRVRVEEGSCIGDGCRLEAEAVITSGADIYPNKTIAAGEVINETVVWESRSPRQMFSGEVFSGVVNIDITPEVAARVAGAFATILPKGGRVAVARDHNTAAHAVSLVLLGALASAGLEVNVLGMIPVPVARSHVGRSCDGGVIVRTAPGRPESLRLMFLDSDGVDIDHIARQDLERIVSRHDIMRAAPTEVGSVSAPMGATEDYVASVMAATDMTSVAEAGLRIVVDTAGGVGAMILPALMSAADVDVITVNSRLTPNRTTGTAAERAESLRRLGLLVASSRAALGVRISPTGERLSIVDETGRVLSDDRALLVFLDLLAAERRDGVVAVPVTTTRVAEQVAEYHGVHMIWSPTGAQALSKASTAQGLILAGDADGGFVIPAVGRSADAMAALVVLLGLVARTRLTLRQIDTRIPSTTLLRGQIPMPWARKASVMRAVREAAADLPIDETEGLRIMLPDRAWVLVAPDPSAAAIRIWAESPREEEAHELLSSWQQVVSAAQDGDADNLTPVE